MPKNYINFINSYMGDPMSFFHGMFADMDRREKEQRNINAGIQEANEFYGAPDKGIEFKYDMLDFTGKFYVGRADSLNHVFNRDGKFLFSCEKFDYLGKDIFIVCKDAEPKKGQSSVYGALYKDGVRITEYDFRSQFASKFNKDSDFCVLGYKEFSNECVVNTEGEIVLELSGYGSIYLYGNIAHMKNAYYNLFTGEVICDNTRSSTLSTKEFLFIETYDEQVYKIDKLTCEVEVFGEAKQRPQTNDIKLCEHSDVKVKESLPKLAKQNRNELCRCGSGLKVKKCNCNS